MKTPYHAIGMMNKKTLFKSIVGLFTLLTVFQSAQAAETVTYYHLNAQGSPVAATNQAGDVIWREQYKPYGERLNKEPAANSNTRWYTGHPQDSDTGLVYAGARYYDPVIGRFMGVDPKTFTEANPHSFNRYAYGNNNPYRYIDPDGNTPVDIIFLGIDLYNFGAAVVSGQGIGQAGIDLGISAIGLASPIPGMGLAIKAGRGVKAVGRGVKKSVVIGENMKDRVIPAAKKLGADYYKPRKTIGDPFKKNERWIDDKMREGREIIDIGPDPRRSKRSPFYEAEKRRIKRRNYPVTK